MIILRFVFVFLFMLITNNTYSSTPNYYTYPPIIDGFDNFHKRISKYDSIELFNSSSIEVQRSDFDEKIMVIAYYIGKYRVSNNYHDLADDKLLFSKNEQKNLIAILNIVTDNSDISKKIFNEFYSDYKIVIKEEKEKCLDFCSVPIEIKTGKFLINMLVEIDNRVNIDDGYKNESNIVVFIINRIDVC